MAYPSDSSTTRRKLSDWLKYEADPNHCRNEAILTAPAGGYDLQTGTLLTGGDTPVPYVESAPKAVTGILITDVKIDEDDDLPIAQLRRGPATINTNEINMPTASAKNTTITTALTKLNFKLVKGVDA